MQETNGWRSVVSLQRNDYAPRNQSQSARALSRGKRAVWGKGKGAQGREPEHQARGRANVGARTSPGARASDRQSARIRYVAGGPGRRECADARRVLAKRKWSLRRPAELKTAEGSEGQGKSSWAPGAQRSMRSTAVLYAAPSHNRIPRVEWCISRERA